ncbi:hypothetical protein ACCE60_000204 [Enterococcus faecium]
MSKKEKLISLIVLVCLVLLVTVIGYQKYHENIRAKKTPTEQYVVYFKKSSVFHFM